jgi:hypothetical protein
MTHLMILDSNRNSDINAATSIQNILTGSDGQSLAQPILYAVQ